LDQIRAAMEASGFWSEFQTDWACLDCELMPWSVKAQELLQTQYAAVGAAAKASLAEAVEQLGKAGEHGLPVGKLLDRFQVRAESLARYVDAYGRYCWPVSSIRDLRLAPFHLLATEGKVHTDRNHLWHIGQIARLVEAAPETSLFATPYQVIELGSAKSEATGIAWWQELTEAGGEGMVVKPLDFVAWERRKLLQPAVKCRGREYLRIIYGPEYTASEHLEELRQRSVTLKRTLALREFALGIEALERFVDRQPLRRVHECVFGVLALESEPVDPRL
jgi:protein phosphatase